jgi:hypothetical protein
LLILLNLWSREQICLLRRELWLRLIHLVRLLSINFFDFFNMVDFYTILFHVIWSYINYINDKNNNRLYLNNDKKSSIHILPHFFCSSNCLNLSYLTYFTIYSCNLNVSQFYIICYLFPYCGSILSFLLASY